MASDGDRISVIWCSAAPVRRHCAARGLPYLELLDVSTGACDLDWLNSGRAPVLAVHRTSGLESHLGVVESAWITNGEGRAIVRLSPRPELASIVADVRAGLLTGVSVGYRVDVHERVPSVASLPAYVARRWRPTELSLVPLPADTACRVLL